MLDQYATVKAIETLLSKPNTEFSVRKLAKEARMSPGASGAALEYMRERCIAIRTVIGRTHQYRANLQSPLCRHWKILFNLEEIEKSGLVEKLIEKNPDALSILLYGSMARGTDDEKSDCDILLVSSAAAKIAPGNIGMAKREVNFTAMGMNEWKRKARGNKVFYENVIYDSIVLFGNRPVVL